MVHLLIDGTPVVRNPKGVGRYAYHTCLQLFARLPEDWSIQIMATPQAPGLFAANCRASFSLTPEGSEIKRALWGVPNQLRRLRPQIFLKTDETSARLIGIPTVTVCHDVDVLIHQAQGVYRSALRRRIDGFVQFLRRQTLRASDCVVCNSEYIREAVHTHYGVAREKTAVGYCAVDPGFYEFSQLTDRAAVCQRYGVTGYVLAFATGDPRENFILYPALAARLRELGIETCLVVGGIRDYRPPYKDQLRADFLALGLVEGRHFIFENFLGSARFRDLVDLYTAADLYVDLSSHEGFGMQLVEAMACGTTCISSRGGAYEEVGDKYVLFVDPTNVNEIALRIKAAYENGLHQAKNCDQVQYTYRFSWDEAGRVIAEALQEVASRRLGAAAS